MVIERSSKVERLSFINSDLPEIVNIMSHCNKLDDLDIYGAKGPIVMVKAQTPSFSLIVTLTCNASIKPRREVSSKFCIASTINRDHRKVRSISTSCLEAHAGFFRLPMKGKFDVYLL